MSEAEVLPGPTTMVAAEHIILRRNICAHTHDFAEVVLVTAGEGDHFTEAGTQRLRSGTLLFLGPNSWHSYGNPPNLTLTNLYVSTALLDFASESPAVAQAAGTPIEQLLTPGLVTARSLAPADTSSLYRSLDRIAEQPARTVLWQLSALFSLLDEIVVVCHAAPVAPTTSLTHEHARLGRGMLRHSTRVSHAVSLLHDQLEHPWTLQVLAAHLNISPSQLTRAFRADLQVGPMTYLQQQRAERMAYLIRTTDLTVGAAGRAVGWNDPSYASRRFSAHWGTSPMIYRDRIHGGLLHE